ncbi:MAG: ABC transporter permease, partial [Gemmatimonadota bacterium]|nr:ABC transporter permease [Gemmatimonadota bacterium]
TGLAHDRRFSIGSVFLIVLATAAFLAPVVTSVNPNVQPDLLGLSAQGPSLIHPFGTDFFSRDVFSRTLYGARWSLTVALLGVTVLTVLGTAVGLISAMGNSVVDTVLMRLVDAGLAVPRLLLLLVLAALWPNLSLAALALVLGSTSWFGLSRMVRAETKILLKSDFVQAAHAMGIPARVTIRRHLLPNLLGPISVSAALGMGHLILLEAGLSFLGLGTRPPTPSWGNIIREGYDILLTAPWISIFPGIAIVAVVVALSLVGDSLQDALKPRAR